MNTRSVWNETCIFEMWMSATASTLWHRYLVVVFAEKNNFNNKEYNFNFQEKYIIWKLIYHLLVLNTFINRIFQMCVKRLTALGQKLNQWFVYHFQIHTQFESLLNFLIPMLSSGTSSLCSMSQTCFFRFDLGLCCNFKVCFLFLNEYLIDLCIFYITTWILFLPSLRY